MTDDDPLRTRREVSTPIVAELHAAGFEDVVEIGRGGFGVVYRCWQQALERTVAVKVSTAELDADNRARFLREQRAMGRLTGHPSIVTVLEANSTATGRPYLVMPYYPQDSLDAWIRKNGPLAVDRVLEIGQKIAGALAAAHRLDIVHRDVKPGNILLAERGEPLLTDFGIAHITGGFRTSAGTLTGSPAFTAPEVIEGHAPTPAADVYGLGATVFSALTGHAAFERLSGENVVTQFLRITSQPVPDLRENGIPDDVAAIVEAAMHRDPHERPSAEALEASFREAWRRHTHSAEDVALRSASDSDRYREQVRAGNSRVPIMASAVGRGGLPPALSRFINRRTELAKVKNLLSTSRLVTLTGIGGVGKTRLALQVASRSQRKFPGGVHLIELADVSDPTLLVDVVAAALGIRDESATRLLDVMIDFLRSRETLLVLDNCEQIVDAVAELTSTLLRTCPEIRILLTTREPLNIAGEAVVRVLPLSVPEAHHQPTLQEMPRFDAITLFVDRAATAVPGFELTDDNRTAVAAICARLEGLPLAIELAAARLRSMSPQQILSRLDDRYALLTRGSRTAPTRQQTLRWSIDWSHDLCTSAERLLWARLSIFTGSFELDAAEEICGTDLAANTTLDVLSSLIDKSILLREEVDGSVRFRMLEMLRDYGREKLQQSGEYGNLRTRHRKWYQQLALDAEAGWISDRQPDLIARLDHELPNLRDALESCSAEQSEEAARTGLQTAASLYEFWNFRGLFSEGRSWVDRALAHPYLHAEPDQVKAFCVGSQLAAAQGDFEGAAVLLDSGRELASRLPDAPVRRRIDYADGILALVRGDSARAASSFERTVDVPGAVETEDLHVSALTLLGLAYEMRGDTRRAAARYREVVSITEPSGEMLFRSVALRGIAVATWEPGEQGRAQQQLEQALRINRRLRSPVATAFSLEALAWTASANGNAERAAVLMGAAQGHLWPRGSNVPAVFPKMARLHEECATTTRHALGVPAYEAAAQEGRAMSIDAAIAYALGEQITEASPETGGSPELTRRELQVARLVARGLSNKQIAAELVISQRTAQGHVEHILTKLGFTSRAQIAAWIAEKPE
ncbi:protein kinase domain-containing protein [Nocardia sp. R7R-8]|uniref:protein kinase domain-containing protein n=1 Tax=Nocardia sp. R7R-8 TaxID=3459304 RepID=UPI00403DA4D2